MCYAENKVFTFIIVGNVDILDSLFLCKNSFKKLVLYFRKTDKMYKNGTKIPDCLDVFFSSL